MIREKSWHWFLGFAILFACNTAQRKLDVGLTLIPPAVISDRVDLEIRAGIKNNDERTTRMQVSFYINKASGSKPVHQEMVSVSPAGAATVKFRLPSTNYIGDNVVTVQVEGDGVDIHQEKNIKVVHTEHRSLQTIGGAWIGFYHWSETEGKMWNPVIKDLSDSQWKEMVSSMHTLGMDIVVMQESFRNQEYVGKHNIERDGYKGKAFYPSSLYASRMPIKAKDPIEAVLSEADELKMNVFVGVGMYAWFDYTTGSLEWHKKVAKELYNRYGKHPSFYGFYVSEEGMGSLDCFETEPALQQKRREEVVSFFESFTPFCRQLAPDKVVMFAPNGWGVDRANGAYARLLKNVDIISPFAFARMPKGDLSGPEAIRLLQQYCDESKTHLWLDLETFVFNKSAGYLQPRQMVDIAHDLTQFNTFEKVICYQYPGVFNNPRMSVRVGEPATVDLFISYQHYVDSISQKGKQK